VKDILRDCCVAEKAGCQRLFSEDLNPGQIYGSIPAVNPFAK
jgi:predicted nucleic acid-binding protein